MNKIILALMFGTIGLATNAKVPVPKYPETKKGNVVDNYFGTKVADPYRWLENDTSKETAAWVEAQRKVTNNYLSHLPYRDVIRKSITGLMDFEKYSAPRKKNGKYYFFRNSGLQNQSVLYRASSLSDPGEVLLDPNKLSADGTVALQSVTYSKNGKYLAYTISRSGSDWVEIYVMETETGKLLTDHIQWAKFTAAAWYKDGFFYSAYDAPTDGSAYSGKNEYHKIY